jgi:sugar lactone lactonase YvrE
MKIKRTMFRFCRVCAVFFAGFAAEAQPVITQQPTNQTVIVGSNATFNVAVSGTGPFTYQWQLNGANLPSRIITTAAGNGTNGYTGDGGAAPKAEISSPNGVVVDGSGNVFIADYGNARIRKISTNGTITTAAGNGANYYTAGGIGAPTGIAVDGSGNMIIANANDNYVIKVSTNGIISTLAGIGTYGHTGDGGPATSAALYEPYGVAVDVSGNVFIADYYNCRIRKVDTNGIITTIAGKSIYGGYSGDGGAATNANLTLPHGVAVDGSGNVFIADSGNNRVRKIDTNGIITTVAGNGTSGFTGDGGAATSAELGSVYGVAVDGSGNLFIADYGEARIRKVDANGIITTVVGNGIWGYSGDGRSSTNAELKYPYGVAVDGGGNVFIADIGDNRIRKVFGFISTNQSLALNSISTNNIGNYSVIISNSAGSVTSSVVSLTFIPDIITQQPQNQLIALGGTATFSVGVANASAIYTSDCYQWYSSTTGLITAGATSQVLSGFVYGIIITNNGFGYTTAPRVQFIGGGGSGAGGTTTISNGQVTAITITNAGSGYSIPPNVVIDPPGLLVNQTNATVILSSITTNNACGYYVVITNYFGSITSSVAFLTILPPPFITQQPSNQMGFVGGNVYFTISASNMSSFTYQWQLNGTNLPNPPSGIVITTVAGNGINGYSGDGGYAPSAELNSPRGVAIDGNGNLFIADYLNNCIRKVSTNQIITTVAGNGTSGYTGDGGYATNAELQTPLDVAIDGGGNMFIADYNCNIRKVSRSGTITTIAGNGIQGYSGDGGAATNARIDIPFGIAVDVKGNLFIADYQNNRIREVSTNGIITTVAGNGANGYSGDGGLATNAMLYYPKDVSVDPCGNLFIADSGNGRIRKVDTNGIITTIATNGTSGIAVDGNGNLFIVASSSILKMSTNGVITTIAGNGINGYTGDGGYATNAEIKSPYGVAVDSIGSVFISGWQDHRIRKVFDFTTNPSLVLNTISTNNAGNYSVVISGSSGSVTSSVANLSIIYITNQPLSCTNQPGSTVAFTVGASVTPSAYQWFKGALPVSGATLASLTLTNIQYSDIANYTVVLTYSIGNMTSAPPASLTVTGPPIITQQPQNQTTLSNANFNVTATGMPPFRYQWWMTGGQQSNAAAVPVVINGFVLAANMTSGGAGYLTIPAVQVVGGSGSGAGGNAVVSNRMVTAITMTNAGSGYTTPPTIQIAAPTAIALTGKTGSVLFLPTLSSTNSGNYYVVVTNNYGSVTSILASLTVALPGYNQISSQLLSNGKMSLSFIGFPGGNYALDYSFSLSPANWIPQTTNLADVNGNLFFTNTVSSATNGFFRIRSVP